MSLRREIAEIIRFWKTPKEAKTIVFYSEHEGYFPYFEGVIYKLTGDYRQSVCYITSDEHDPVFATSRKSIKPFYINKLLTFFMALIDVKVVIMTMPDLNLFHIKRSRNPVHYVYMYHSLVSTHMMYLAGAFDHYDSVLCTGRYQVEEIREREQAKRLKKKTLVEAGYYRLERVHSAYRKHEEEQAEGGKKTVLIAPSWGEDNILESVGDKLVGEVLNGGFKVIVRPHPETVRRTPGIVDGLETRYGSESDFTLERSVAGDDSLLAADVLVCDLSGVALEYALGTERPVLFIESPVKVRNREYTDSGITPIELAIREKIGIIIKKDELTKITLYISDIIAKREIYRQQIVDLRDELVFHFGESSKIGADYIMRLAGSNPERGNQ